MNDAQERPESHAPTATLSERLLALAHATGHAHPEILDAAVAIDRLSATRDEMIEDVLDVLMASAWKHEGDDLYSQGMDTGARAQLTACIAAMQALKERRRLQDTQHRRDLRQKRVATWCASAFGEAAATSLPQRGLRLLEEAIEAYQACGAPREMAHDLVDFVFARPVGEVGQEIGGIAVTLLALAQAAGVSAEACEVAEIARVLAKPLAHWTVRNEAKNAAGFDTSERATAPQKELTPGAVEALT